MNIPAEFDKIRPYTPEELPKIYEELIADPSFRAVVESVMPGIPFEALALRRCVYAGQTWSSKKHFSTDYYGIW